MTVFFSCASGPRAQNTVPHRRRYVGGGGRGWKRRATARFGSSGGVGGARGGGEGAHDRTRTAGIRISREIQVFPGAPTHAPSAQAPSAHQPRASGNVPGRRHDCIVGRRRAGEVSPEGGGGGGP